MNLVQRETTTGNATTGAKPHLDTRLHGRWLFAARATWVALALVMVVLNVLALPGFAASFLNPEVTQELGHLDFSPAFYLALNLGMAGGCMLLYLGIGALLFWRRPDERMAFFGALMLLAFGGTACGFLQGGSAPIAPAWIWNLVISGPIFLGQVSFLTFFYLFPSGRFVPRWTRWCALLYAVYQLASLLFPQLSAGPLGRLILLFLLTAVIAQIYRYRSVSTSRERQQTRWVVFGFVCAMLIFVSTRLIAFLLPPAILNSQVAASLIGGGSVYLALILIPIFIGIAILRAQLFDIDIIIKRALVYGTLTALVVGIYVLVVGYLGAVFHSGGSLLISLIATGLVAVLFQPLRAFLQRGINRLLYGLRDEPYVVLTRLGQRLKTTLDPDAVLSTIVATVREALKLSYAAIEVQEGAGVALAASSGTLPAKEALRLPLMHQGEAVGTLLIVPRGRDDTLTPADLRLIDDLTHQIGVAVHAVRLTDDLRALTRDLQRSREHLVTAREEERLRLRRDLHDGLGPTLSAIMLKVGLIRTLHRRDSQTTDALLNQLEREIESAIGDIRRVVYNLRPPALDELGLAGALREYGAGFNHDEQQHDAPRVTVEAPASLPPLPAAVEVAAYRIVQEAVTNVVRHAHAHSCRVSIQMADVLQVEVSDDGLGLDEADRAGVGLTSMRERAEELGGTLTIRKIAPSGTQVTAALPLPDATRVDAHM